MSRQQANHFIPLVKRADKKRARLLARLAMLKRQWNTQDHDPFYNVRRKEMNPPQGGWQKELWDRQSGRCAYCCKILWPRYHYDHVHPKSKGGPSTPDNFYIACEPCNLQKHDQDGVTFAIKLLSSTFPPH